MVQNFQNAIYIDKSLCINSCFSITTGLLCSTKIVIEKFLHLEKKWVETYLNPVLALELRLFKVTRKYGLISMFDLVIVQNESFDFCVQDLELNLFTSVGLIRSKIMFSFFVVES